MNVLVSLLTALLTYITATQSPSSRPPPVTPLIDVPEPRRETFRAPGLEYLCPGREKSNAQLLPENGELIARDDSFVKYCPEN